MNTNTTNKNPTITLTPASKKVVGAEGLRLSANVVHLHVNALWLLVIASLGTLNCGAVRGSDAYMAFQWRFGVLRHIRNPPSSVQTHRPGQIRALAQNRGPAKSATRTHGRPQTLQCEHYGAPFVLSSTEKNLFGLFKTIVKEENMRTTVRVAGGWVRDKILGLDSKMDVDVALDNMTGVEFAKKINDWCKRNGKNQFVFGVISKNPDKSKHLETATMNILGFSIDFVNLRTETYSCDSRIPQIEIGTPAEDAYRRDLTINSLFFNVNTGEVEDFTGLGLQDIHDKKIRTPLAPDVTFLDDPLRVLRSIRFASRLGFTMAPELLTATQNPEVCNALAHKVSRERIAQEVKRMLQNTFFPSIGLLFSLNLLPIVFCVPSAPAIQASEIMSPLSQKQVGGRVGESLIHHMYTDSVALLCASQYVLHTQRLALSDSARQLLDYLCEAESDCDVYIHRLALLVFPTASACTSIATKQKARIRPLSEHIIHESLRMPSKVSMQTMTIHETALKLIRLLINHSRAYLRKLSDLPVHVPVVDDVAFLSIESLNDVSVGVGHLRRLHLAEIFRDSNGLGRHAMMTALAWDLVDSHACSVHYQNIQPNLCVSPEGLLRAAVEVDTTAFEACVEAMGGILYACETMQVFSSIGQPPVLSGEKLKRLLPKLEGTAFGAVMDAQLKLKFARPSCSESEVKSFLIYNFPQYR